MSSESHLQSPIAEFEKTNAILGHFKALVDSSDDAIVSKDLNGIIQTWNKGAEKIFGYTAQEVIGKSVTILFPPEQLHEENTILERIRAGERIDHYETVRRRKDGQLLDISLTVSPILDGAGKIMGASKIARDITKKKKSETEFMRSHQELEKADRAKDGFLAMLSHELRTPLNPILLVASNGAADPSLPQQIRADFEMILKSTEMETRLIDDLLGLARVKAGKLKLVRSEVNIHDILATSISTLQSQAGKKQIVLAQNVNDSESVVLGDGVRLQQVFLNILRNAIKFTPMNGTVTVTAKSCEGQYVVTVSDTGIGMTAGDLAALFEPFRQAESSKDADQSGGLGLGLAISKQLVRFHGGSIEAASQGPGCGCKFTVRLPLLSQADGLSKYRPHTAE
ncbi:MAG: PAS domain-containing sensor histidine kinase, partial [Limisphaerales bacterium]